MKIRKWYLCSGLQLLGIVVLSILSHQISFAQIKSLVITRDVFFRALEEGKNISKRITITKFEAILNSQGVDFRLTADDKKEIFELGAYYGKAGLNNLIAAIRKNFRAKPSLESSLKMEYRIVKGYSLNFFLEKDNKKNWAALGIDGNASIVISNTYKTLALLAQKFSDDLGSGDYFETQIDNMESSKIEITEKDRQKKYFIGGFDDLLLLSNDDFLKSLNDPKKPWRVIMSTQTDFDFGSPLLMEIGLQFAFKLKSSEDKVSIYLRNQLDLKTQELLQQLPPPSYKNSFKISRLQREALIKGLVNDLNKLLINPLFYKQEVFKEIISQSVEIQNLISQEPREDQLIRLNRRLLANAYLGLIDVDNLTSIKFFKPIEKEDFGRSRGDDKLVSFYEYITQNNLPPDLGFVKSGIEHSGGCSGEDPPHFFVNVQMPYIVLKIAVFENTSTGDVLKIGNFNIRENNSLNLRSKEDDTILFNSQEGKAQNLYPFGILKPGEKIIVPLELMLEHGGNSFVDEGGVSSTPLPTTEEIVRKHPKIYLGDDIYMETSKILEMLRRPQLKFPIQQKYLYGPSVKIDDVEVNGFSYQVRSYNPETSLLTSEGFIGASCPFVYTYDSKTRSWLKEGVIMAGFNSKDKKSTNSKLLQRFNERF